MRASRLCVLFLVLSLAVPGVADTPFPTAQDSARANICHICGRTRIMVHGLWICPKHGSGLHFEAMKSDSLMTGPPGDNRQIKVPVWWVKRVEARLDSLSAVVRKLEREVWRH